MRCQVNDSEEGKGGAQAREEEDTPASAAKGRFAADISARFFRTESVVSTQYPAGRGPAAGGPAAASASGSPAAAAARGSASAREGRIVCSASVGSPIRLGGVQGRPLCRQGREGCAVQRPRALALYGEERNERICEQKT